MASIFMKTFVLSAAMSATAWAGVGDSYLSHLTYLFKRERSTHIRMPSVSFLGVTTIGAHHSVGSVTGSMMPCVWSTISSALSLSRYANGTDRGVLMQKGLASSVSDMWNSSPSIVFICPLKTSGNSFIMSSEVGNGLARADASRVLTLVVGGCSLLIRVVLIGRG